MKNRRLTLSCITIISIFIVAMMRGSENTKNGKIDTIATLVDDLLTFIIIYFCIFVIVNVKIAIGIFIF